MAIEDLDLEFEEEEEAKSEAIDIGDDLVFSNAPDEEPSTETEVAYQTTEAEVYQDSPQTTSTSNLSSSDATDPNLRLPQEILSKQKSQQQKAKNKPAKRKLRRAIPKKPVAEVRDIAQARKKIAKQEEKTKPSIQLKQETQTVPTPDMSMYADVGIEGVLASQVQFMQQQVLDLQAQLIAELKKNGGGSPDQESMKEMEAKMNKVFSRIVKKVPALRNEVLMLKKIMQEFKK